MRADGQTSTTSPYTPPARLMAIRICRGSNNCPTSEMAPVSKTARTHCFDQVSIAPRPSRG
jgi:hypothetical protein